MGDDRTVTRTVHVGSGRLERWVTGFGERHPGVLTAVHADRVELAAPDGATATLYPVFGPLPHIPSPTPAAAAAALVADAHGVPVLRALLIRRGGYACAVVEGDRVSASKVGSRYVQGRTAAGGWSQQRFARRREGQVHALVGSATEVAVRILLPGLVGGPGVGGQPGRPDQALVTGGDRGLLERVLADPRLAPLRRLPAGPHLEIGDPRSDLVRDLPQAARAVRVVLGEGGPRACG